MAKRNFKNLSKQRVPRKRDHRLRVRLVAQIGSQLYPEHGQLPPIQANPSCILKFRVEHFSEFTPRNAVRYIEREFVQSEIIVPNDGGPGMSFLHPVSGGHQRMGKCEYLQRTNGMK